MSLTMASIESVENWAQSAGGKPLSLHKSVKSETRPILIVGGVHGDEPEGVWLAEHCLNWLRTFTPALPWLLIPCFNPDGFAIRERTNSNGVDLNRNFPCGNWSSQHSKPRYFPGPGPGSEPETQALVKLIKNENPQLIIHCHSWQPCVVYTGDPALRDAQRLADSSGYPAKPDIGYPTPGSLGEYGWHDCGIPVICIEELDPTPEPLIWPRFQKGFEQIFSDPTPR